MYPVCALIVELMRFSVISDMKRGNKLLSSSCNLKFTPQCTQIDVVLFPSYTADAKKGKVWIWKKKTERKEETHKSEMYSAIKVIRDKGGKRVLEVYDDERSSRGS